MKPTIQLVRFLAEELAIPVEAISLALKRCEQTLTSYHDSLAIWIS